MRGNGGFEVGFTASAMVGAMLGAAFALSGVAGCSATHDRDRPDGSPWWMAPGEGGPDESSCPPFDLVCMRDRDCSFSSLVRPICTDGRWSCPEGTRDHARSCLGTCTVVPLPDGCTCEYRWGLSYFISCDVCPDDADEEGICEYNVMRCGERDAFDNRRCFCDGGRWRCAPLETPWDAGTP